MAQHLKRTKLAGALATLGFVALVGSAHAALLHDRLGRDAQDQLFWEVGVGHEAGAEPRRAARHLRQQV